MTSFSIFIGIVFAYWWHFQRVTPREREFKENQQQKKLEWNKYNMSNQQNQQTQKNESKADWDKYNMDSFK